LSDFEIELLKSTKALSCGIFFKLELNRRTLRHNTVYNQRFDLEVKTDFTLFDI